VNSDRYTFRTTITNDDYRDYDLEADILFDGTPVVYWSDSYNFYMAYNCCVFRALDNAEAVILAALGMESNQESVLGVMPVYEDRGIAQLKFEAYFITL